MAKSERLFEMLQYIREYPDLTVQDLSRLCNVSERGIYRYINTLSRAGFPVRLQNGGYRVPEDRLDLLEKVDVRNLEAVKDLLSIGMKHSTDDQLIKHGKDFMELIDENLPWSKKKIPGEMTILPTGVRATNYGGTVRIGHSSKPDIINPILTSETISISLMSLIFSCLVGFDGSMRPIPDLARRWEVSDDGLVWTFFLRDDVRFHDDHPLTAKDVEFTYRAILDQRNTSSTTEQYNIIDRLETEGDYIFRVVLKRPFAPFIYRMSRSIVPKHLLEDADFYNTPFNRQPIGSGPFKLVDWSEDDTIVLEANRRYFFKGRPVLDKLVFKTYPDRQTALKAISQGEMDIALNLAAADLAFVSRRRAFRVYQVSSPAYYAIIFDLNNPMFEDMRVRKALDCAIDRDSIIKNQLKGYSSICTGPFAVDSWPYNPDVQSTPYDIEKARELLEQAGWRDSDGDGVLDKDGEAFEISLTMPNISDSLERVAVAIRAQLMKVGIRTKLVYIDDSELHKTQFQAILSMIITSTDPDYAYQVWHSESGDMNLASYKNKFVDELLELGRQTTDIEKRKAIYHRVHRIIHDDYPAVFLASGREFIGSNYRFRDAKFSSMPYFLTTMKDWQIIGEEKEGADYERQQKTGVIS
ncbi:ABC transporter substrate-binding protein [Candidatus Poribacteria bacterium]